MIVRGTTVVLATALAFGSLVYGLTYLVPATWRPWMPTAAIAGGVVIGAIVPLFFIDWIVGW